MKELKEYAKRFIGVTLYTDGQTCRVAISSPISKVKDFPINDKESIKNYIKKNARNKELFFKKIALEHPRIEYKQISPLTKEEYKTLLNTLNIAIPSLEPEDVGNVQNLIKKIHAAESVFYILSQSKE